MTSKEKYELYQRLEKFLDKPEVQNQMTDIFIEEFLRNIPNIKDITLGSKYEFLQGDNMNEDRKPIYRILLFSKIPTLDKLGWPDCGTQDDVGFYYEYETAVRAMHENWCDIHEGVFKAGFILTLLPGLYESAIKELRTYFEWDEERGGFFEKEEPELFKYFSY